MCDITDELFVEIQQAEFAFNSLKFLVGRNSVLVPSQITILQGKLSHLADCYGYFPKFIGEYTEILNTYKMSLKFELKAAELNLKLLN